MSEISYKYVSQNKGEFPLFKSYKTPPSGDEISALYEDFVKKTSQSKVKNRLFMAFAAMDKSFELVFFCNERKKESIEIELEEYELVFQYEFEKTDIIKFNRGQKNFIKFTPLTKVIMNIPAAKILDTYNNTIYEVKVTITRDDNVLEFYFIDLDNTLKFFDKLHKKMAFIAVE